MIQLLPFIESNDKGEAEICQGKKQVRFGKGEKDRPAHDLPPITVPLFKLETRYDYCFK